MRKYLEKSVGFARTGYWNIPPRVTSNVSTGIGNGTGFWARARKAPEPVSEHVRQLQQGLLANARAETKAVRQSQVNNQFPIWRAPLDQYLTEVPKALNGDEKISVAAWRLDTLNFWSLHLNRLLGQPTPLSNAGGYIDWLSAELDLPLMFHPAAFRASAISVTPCGVW